MERKRVGVYVGVFAAALAVRAAYWALGGTRISPDGYTYLGTCGSLWPDFLSGLQGSVGIEYLTFLVPFCGFMALPFTTAAHWVILQIVATSVATVLVAHAAWRLWGPIPALVAGGSLALLWETAQWDIYVLSESTFVFWLAFVFWAYARRATTSESRTSETAVLWGGLIMLAFARPVGIPIVGLMLLAEFVPRALAASPKMFLRPAIGGLAVGVMVMITTIISDRSSWSSAVFDEVWIGRLIVHDDPAFRYPFVLDSADNLFALFVANPLHVSAIALLKALVLYLPFVPRFSLIHNGMNAMTLVPVMILGFYGLASAVRQRDGRVWIWLAPMVAVTLVTMATFVDYDWRYRVPLTLGLVMGTGFAFSESTAIGHLARSRFGAFAGWIEDEIVSGYDEPRLDPGGVGDALSDSN